MSEDQRERSRALVDLAALDPYSPVLDHVDPPPPVRSYRRAHRRHKLVQCHRRPVETDGHAPLEAEDELSRFPRRGRCARRERVDLLGWLDPRILEDAA